jgi:hypothetical protein
MTDLLEAVILISFIFLTGLAFGLLAGVTIGRKKGGPGPGGGDWGPRSG